MKRFLAALAVLAISRDADPCSIVIPTNVLPASAPAPINAHVWVRSPSRQGKYLLRAVSPSSAEIAIATREWCPQLVEIVPQAPLPPSARFELWIVEKDKLHLLASFGTGTATDTVPPPKPTFTSAVRDVLDDRQCGTSETVTLAGGTGEVEAMYAVWPSDEKGSIAWSNPPSVAFSGASFDSYRLCQASGKPTFAAWSRIGIRAMDVAGNLGEPLVLDLVKK